MSHGVYLFLGSLLINSLFFCTELLPIIFAFHGLEGFEHYQNNIFVTLTFNTSHIIQGFLEICWSRLNLDSLKKLCSDTLMQVMMVGTTLMQKQHSLNLKYVWNFKVIGAVNLDTLMQVMVFLQSFVYLQVFFFFGVHVILIFQPSQLSLSIFIIKQIYLVRDRNRSNHLLEAYNYHTSGLVQARFIY